MLLMEKKFNSLSSLARKILFEDTYPRYTTQSFRAGTQFVDDVPVASGEPEESDPEIELPVEISPQTSTQLSSDQPPVDDPDFEPVNSKELASALYVLAQRLPDRLVASVYKKFEEYVARHSMEDLSVAEDVSAENDEIEMLAAEEITERLAAIKKILEN